MLQALCRHENIVGYQGAYQTSPQHFGLVLEAFDMSLESWLFTTGQDPLKTMTSSGGDLKKWCTARSIITGDMLEGLQFLHTVGKAGVVHRDIKLGNVLIRLAGVGKDAAIIKAAITDFGFCCSPGSDFETPGTVRYMSPELLRNQPWGHPVDVWAMGVTLMMLWTGTKVLGSLDDHFIEVETVLLSIDFLICFGRTISFILFRAHLYYHSLSGIDHFDHYLFYKVAYFNLTVKRMKRVT